ncbi:hypothetical protein EW145_g3888 [Phellinidium pouzarii]|uniref:Uncharacterized protein n=1 Tax=Phellinidium pouzarii TaxID=167371 RepID=A0A4V3XCP6_9AGAM|nr:hypothetical protein EW145_g3888 [Phellinidium pouzarii]
MEMNFSKEFLKTPPKLKILAWADDGEENGLVVMALKHISKPFWGVQYHPESVCTDGSGLRIIQNFWRMAHDWQLKNGRRVKLWDGTAQSHFSGNLWPPLHFVDASRIRFNPQHVTYSKLSLPQLSVTQICEVLGVYKANTDFALLDTASQPGSHSIIGCIHPSTLKIQYFLGDMHVTLIQRKQRTSCSLGTSDIWAWLAAFMQTKVAIGGDPSVPFWGGLVGHLSYELGVDTIKCGRPRNSELNEDFPGVNLVFIERSIVIDVKTGQVFLQSLLSEDDDWFAYIASVLKRAANSEDKANKSKSPLCPLSAVKPTIIYPNKEQYIAKVKKAQDYLSSGESYELCLTAQTRILVPQTRTPSFQSSWELYKGLRLANPAPYAVYLRLGPTTLISSSPERPKEIGENLMIVDLIRHDLYGMVGTGVNVKKFCGIEEYETMWQLVSVIEGEFQPPVSAEYDNEDDHPYDSQLGWSVLRASLPPGSMTGAPKKRSVQLLQGLENGERGVYSGVVGYWCVSGGGDWSVVIRSCFKLDEVHRPERQIRQFKNSDAEYDEWIVGAGGAITALSDPESEWDEMVTKLQCVLKAFCADEQIATT